MATNTLFDGDAYWNDSWVQELDGEEERLYHFYITSPNLDKSGVYKQTERSVDFYVRGLGLDKIREITEKFTKAKKVIRCGEWIIVPTSLKHQNYKNNQKVITSIVEYLKKIPLEVFEALRECDYPLDLNTIRPPKEAKNDDLPLKTDDLSMTYSCTTDDLPLKTDEFNSIELNSIELNLNKNLNGNSMSEQNPENQGGCEQPGENSPPPPNLLQIIKDKAKAQSFYLDDPVVRKIAKAIPNWQWFTDQHSIIDFVTRKITDIYRDKPKAEHKKLFISALTSWDNIKDEYSDWLATQIKADENVALELLRKTPPTHCLSCGTELEKDTCPKCKGSVFFSEEKKAWEYQEYFDFSAKLAEMRQGLGKEQKPDGEPEIPKEDNPDDIDF